MATEEKEKSPRGGVVIGPVAGGIINSIIAGGNVLINQFRTGGDMRAREILSVRVKTDWVDEFLRESLSHADYVPLTLKQRSELNGVSERRLHDAPINSLEELAAALSQTDPSPFLMLGEPGAGKTTFLLECMRRLLARENHSDLTAIPVLINLSKWRRGYSSARFLEREPKDKRPPFEQWLSHEIANAYRIRESFPREWLQSGALIVFLDGLDEVPDRERSVCAHELSDFLKESLCSVVISCRTEIYEELGAKLPIKSVSQLSPLSDDEVDSFLSSRGLGHDILSDIRLDAELESLTRSPLMLGILVRTSKQNDLDTVSEEQELSKLHAVFQAYTISMLKAKGIFDESKARGILSTLQLYAAVLAETSALQFSLEDLAPQFLKTSSGQRRYRYCAYSALAMTYGLVFWFAYVVGFVSYVSHNKGWLLQIVVYSLFFGFHFHSKWFSDNWEPYAPLRFSREGFASGMGLAAILGVAFPTAVVLYVGLSLLLAALLVYLGSFSLVLPGIVVLGVVIACIVSEDARHVVFGAVAIGVWFGFLTLFLYWLSGVSQGEDPASNVFVYFLAFAGKHVLHYPDGDPMPSFGLSILWKLGAALSMVLAPLLAIPMAIETVPAATGFRPGKLLTKSLLNAAALAASATVLTLLVIESCHLLYHTRMHMTGSYSMFAVLNGLLVFLLVGGDLSVRHYILRLLLSVEGIVPFGIVGQLNEATRAVLIRRSAKKFIFLHRIQLEYFASMRPQDLDKIILKVRKHQSVG